MTTRALYEGWMRFWFAPKDPANLAVCRILFFGFIFLFYLPVDFALWGDVADVFWRPTFFFGSLNIPALSPSTLGVLQVLWKAALALSCVGLLTRVSTATAFVLGFYLLGLPHNMGKVYHTDALLVFVFGIMTIARCADAWSVDHWWRSRKRRDAAWPAESGEYRWPVRAVWLLLSLIFFAAGFAKTKDSGLAWVFSENMGVLLVKQQYGNDALVDWGVYLAQWPLLYQAMAGATVLLELGYPLAMISRRARWLFVPGMALAQIGIRVLMGPWFPQFLLCNLFWIPWDRLGPVRRLRARSRRGYLGRHGSQQAVGASERAASMS